MDPLVLLLAFVAGLGFRRAGMPPLLGFLLAGFVGNALGWSSLEALAPLADAGILLLLFTIGLKLDPGDLAPRYVWGSALLHIVIVVPLTAAVLYLCAAIYDPLEFIHPAGPWTLAFALSFSSTVLAIKLFEDRGETASFYARIAIGVLVVQDVLAVVYLVATSGHWPAPWALALLGLPLLAPALRRLLPAIGHGELLLLAGILFAFGAAALFEAAALKGGLGALVAGMLLKSSHREKAKEVYEQLHGLQNLLLIGFFVQIGYYGLPSLEMMVIASIVAALTLLRPVVYFALLVRFGLRARTGWLTGLSLFSYSEFGLIVSAIAVEAGMLAPVWVTTIALALAISFVLATPANRLAHELFRRHEALLVRQEHAERLPEERVGSLGDARTVILGMGRIGRGAYDALALIAAESGNFARAGIVGVEENVGLVAKRREEGYACIHGDASDRDFWERTGLARRDTILVGLTIHGENLRVVRMAHELGFTGTIGVACRFPDERRELEALGCRAYYLYEDVGGDFARHVVHELSVIGSAEDPLVPAVRDVSAAR